MICYNDDLSQTFCEIIKLKTLINNMVLYMHIGCEMYNNNKKLGRHKLNFVWMVANDVIIIIDPKPAWDQFEYS